MWFEKSNNTKIPHPMKYNFRKPLSLLTAEEIVNAYIEPYRPKSTVLNGINRPLSQLKRITQNTTTDYQKLIEDAKAQPNQRDCMIELSKQLIGELTDTQFSAAIWKLIYYFSNDTMITQKEFQQLQSDNVIDKQTIVKQKQDIDYLETALAKMKTSDMQLQEQLAEQFRLNKVAQTQLVGMNQHQGQIRDQLITENEKIAAQKKVVEQNFKDVSETLKKTIEASAQKDIALQQADVQVNRQIERVTFLERRIESINDKNTQSLIKADEQLQVTKNNEQTAQRRLIERNQKVAELTEEVSKLTEELEHANSKSADMAEQIDKLNEKLNEKIKSKDSKEKSRDVSRRPSVAPPPGLSMGPKVIPDLLTAGLAKNSSRTSFHQREEALKEEAIIDRRLSVDSDTVETAQKAVQTEPIVVKEKKPEPKVVGFDDKQVQKDIDAFDQCVQTDEVVILPPTVHQENNEESSVLEQRMYDTQHELSLENESQELDVGTQTETLMKVGSLETIPENLSQTFLSSLAPIAAVQTCDSSTQTAQASKKMLNTPTMNQLFAQSSEVNDDEIQLDFRELQDEMSSSASITTQQIESTEGHMDELAAEFENTKTVLALKSDNQSHAVIYDTAHCEVQLLSHIAYPQKIQFIPVQNMATFKSLNNFLSAKFTQIEQHVTQQRISFKQLFQPRQEVVFLNIEQMSPILITKLNVIKFAGAEYLQLKYAVEILTLKDAEETATLFFDEIGKIALRSYDDQRDLQWLYISNLEKTLSEDDAIQLFIQQYVSMMNYASCSFVCDAILNIVRTSGFTRWLLAFLLHNVWFAADSLSTERARMIVKKLVDKENVIDEIMKQMIVNKAVQKDKFICAVVIHHIELQQAATHKYLQYLLKSQVNKQLLRKHVIEVLKISYRGYYFDDNLLAGNKFTPQDIVHITQCVTVFHGIEHRSQCLEKVTCIVQDYMKLAAYITYKMDQVEDHTIRNKVHHLINNINDYFEKIDVLLKDRQYQLCYYWLEQLRFKMQDLIIKRLDFEGVQ